MQGAILSTQLNGPPSLLAQRPGRALSGSSAGRPALVSHSHPLLGLLLPRASYLPEQVVISQGHRPPSFCQPGVVNKSLTTAHHSPPRVAALPDSCLLGPAGNFSSLPSAPPGPRGNLCPHHCPWPCPSCLPSCCDRDVILSQTLVFLLEAHPQPLQDSSLPFRPPKKHHLLKSPSHSTCVTVFVPLNCPLLA